MVLIKLIAGSWELDWKTYSSTKEAALSSSNQIV